MMGAASPATRCATSTITIDPHPKSAGTKNSAMPRLSSEICMTTSQSSVQENDRRSEIILAGPELAGATTRAIVAPQVPPP